MSTDELAELAPTPVGPAGTLTPKQVSEACRVSLRTVRRWLAAGQLPGAYQSSDGCWHVPPGALTGRLPTGAAPAPERAPTPAPADELERLRTELAELRHRDELRALELAHAAELRRVLEANLEDARRSLRILEAGLESGPGPGPVMGPPVGPVAGAPTGVRAESAAGRRWWRRGSA
jgi:hypothetical protein